MRLLNAETYSLEQFFEPQIPSYAILSHRWEEDELTFTDIQGSDYMLKKGFEKVNFACGQASADGLEFVWIDTCCIDKSSSAELQEAINSMFRWYQRAVVCYAYLSDVLPYSGGSSVTSHAFPLAASVWFKRGWTLQELIAPEKVMFYGMSWFHIGSRNTLWEEISHITGIHREALWQHRQPVEMALRSFSIAQRMSWAASRKTTRIEDRAYSLMGLFGVNMPLLYGEGQRAFVRLQEEILKVGTDLSILAWSHSSGDRSDKRELLAVCPEDFAGCNNILRSPQMDQPFTEAITMTMTNVGLRVEKPLIVKSLDGPPGHGLALSLECRTDEDITKVTALKLEPSEMPSLSVLSSQHQSENSNRLCYSGWDNDGARGDGRLLSVGLLEPARSPSWPALTISREFIPSRLSYQDAAQWYTHTWIQLPEDSHAPPWRVSKIWPEEYWNFKNLTFNLQDVIRDRVEPEKILDKANEWLFGAIALSDNLDSQIAVFFGLKTDIVQNYHLGRSFRYGVSKYNPATFPGPEDDLDTKVNAGDKWIELSRGRKVVVRLNSVKRSGILIARLAISIKRTMSDKTAEIKSLGGPPYELGASD